MIFWISAKLHDVCFFSQRSWALLFHMLWACVTRGFCYVWKDCSSKLTFINAKLKVSVSRCRILCVFAHVFRLRVTRGPCWVFHVWSFELNQTSSYIFFQRSWALLFHMLQACVTRGFRYVRCWILFCVCFAHIFRLRVTRGLCWVFHIWSFELNQTSSSIFSTIVSTFVPHDAGLCHPWILLCLKRWLFKVDVYQRAIRGFSFKMFGFCVFSIMFPDYVSPVDFA